ncbi:MAG: holin family protein [Gemmatimonadota bacterium]|nr:holin family protein [Gemmatimonadota bacterium]
MSNPITDLFTGGLSGLTDSVKGILDKFIADPKDKLAAQLQVEEMAHDLAVKGLEADKELAVQQASVVTAEVKSDSWLARNWRPITMLTFVFIIVWNYIVVGTIGAFAPSIHPIEIPPDMWSLLKLGIGGYIGARTVEKVSDKAADVVAAIKK